MTKRREVRLQRRLDGWDSYKEVPLVEVQSKAWIMVRRADVRGAAPSVVSRKEWDSMPIQDAE